MKIVAVIHTNAAFAVGNEYIASKLWCRSADRNHLGASGFTEVTASLSESAQPENTTLAPSKVSHAELAIKTIDSETTQMKLCVNRNCISQILYSQVKIDIILVFIEHIIKYYDK